MTKQSSGVVAEVNGHEQAERKERKERKTGLAYMRQAELMHLSQVASNALREAELLAEQVHRQAFNAHVRTDHEAPSEVDLDSAARSIQDALVLTGMAEHYLQMVGDTVAASHGDPWGRAL